MKENQRDHQGQTSIHYCAMYGQYHLLCILWTSGQSIEDKIMEYTIQTGVNPLHLACSSFSVDTVIFLINNGLSLTETTIE